MLPRLPFASFCCVAHCLVCCRVCPGFVVLLTVSCVAVYVLGWLCCSLSRVLPRLSFASGVELLTSSPAAAEPLVTYDDDDDDDDSCD